MAIERLWAGKVFGTHTGNLFVKLEGEDAHLSGTLRFNDPAVGLAVYAIAGSFDGRKLDLTGTPQTQAEGIEYGRLTATAQVDPKGNLLGEWQTSIGSAGTFVLFPHAHPQLATAAATPDPDQMYTRRHNFGPIEIDIDQIIALADDIQRTFPNGRLIVTFTTDTEQSRFLSDFKILTITSSQAVMLKLFVREPDAAGIDRLVTVEFGPSINWAMCQGVNESWVLGEIERLKREISKFERFYAPRAFGVGINEFMLVSAIVYLPSLSSLRDRAILMAGVVGLVYSINWIHSRYLPHAAIYLTKKKDGWIMRILPSVASWIVGIAATVIASLLAAYLQGWLPLLGS